GAAAPPSAALALGGYRDLRGRIRALRVDAQLPRFAQLVTLGSAIAIPLACAGHAEPSGMDRSRCAALQVEATRAHDRFEAGETEQAPVATAAYDAFAEQCADAAELTDLLYYRAELHWALAHAIESRGDDASDAFAQAHEAFLDALDAGTERFEIDAATAQMLAKRAELGLATTTVVAAQPEPKPAVREGSIHEERRTDYDADEVELLASYTRFEAHVEDPANAELQQVLLHRASLAMRHARWDDARVAAERLLAGSDGGLVHVRAAEILVDLHTIAATDPAASAATTASATDALVQLCGRLPTMALWKHPEATRLHEAVPTLHAGMRWRTADRLAASGNPTACGEIFEALAREHPEHPRHDVMLRNGMTCFQDGGEHTHAAELARQLLDAHPGSDHAALARALLDER
ncbi:MAG: hypothetical protein IAG13_16065, partial [Deltaproteobacteria bacterium]|nr:hypothetical protein [Nannocystaceae bacterium]